MSLLIDGYNLLHATGIVGTGRGPGWFERSRLALLNFLADSIAPEEVPRTTVVFDAADAPPGLPRLLKHRGLTVQFARNPEGADALIEELIQSDTSPRKLTVVSSDHRLHRAARRRKAKAVDSDVWYAAVLASRQSRQRDDEDAQSTKPTNATAEEVQHWLREFGVEDDTDR